MNIHAQAVKQQPYSGFDGLPIGGEWLQGKMRALKVIDYGRGIWRGRAHPDPLGTGAGKHARRGLHPAAHVMEMRRDEIVSWLIRESGSTHLKANLEWASHAIIGSVALNLVRLAPATISTRIVLSLRCRGVRATFPAARS